MSFSFEKQIQRAAITTLGCKVNTYESAMIAQKLRADDWAMVSPKDSADLYVINSCTVTAEAGRQTRQEIRRAVRRNPDALVVVTGCYAEMEADICDAIPGVDLVVGNADKMSIVERIREYHEAARAVSIPNGANHLKGVSEDLLSGFDDRTRAFVQVQQGCDQSCTFCIIHQARGAGRSFPLAQVARQIELLIARDYREIVICGVDLGSWGADLDNHSSSIHLDIVTLLKRVSDLAGDYRIRLSSIDPIHLTDELLELISFNDRFCSHLHISLQSANTLILKRMKRRYGADLLYQRIEAARSSISGLVLSADILVGFPTESEIEFEDTLRAVDDLEIAYPHVFTYSALAGTPAARIPAQVPMKVRKERSALVRATGNAVRQRLLSSQIGQHGRVLVEHTRSSSECQSHGRLANYVPVHVTTGNLPAGDFIDVDITGQGRDVLIAQAEVRE